MARQPRSPSKLRKHLKLLRPFMATSKAYMKCAMLLAALTVALMVLHATSSLGGCGASSRLDHADQFTLVLDASRSEASARRAIRHYSQCSRIKRIHVNWRVGGRIPDLEAQVCCDAPLTVSYPHHVNRTTPDTAFMLIPRLASEGVLVLDEDIIAPCHSLDAAFQEWRQRKTELVGWFPRLLIAPVTGGARYVGRWSALMWHGRYSAVLTRAAFVHSRYFGMFSNPTPQNEGGALVKMVATLNDCEDIVMQFMVSEAAHAAPYFIWDPAVRDMGAGWFPWSQGSARPENTHIRTQCIHDLSENFPEPRSRSVWEHTYGLVLRLSPLLDPLLRLLPCNWPAAHSGACRCERS